MPTRIACLLVGCVSLALWNWTSEAMAWDGNWTQARSGTDYIYDSEDSQGKAGTPETPLRFLTPPVQDEADVDPEEIEDYFGHGRSEYSPYALARITQPIRYNDVMIPPGYYLIKPGDIHDGSPRIRLKSRDSEPAEPFSSNAPSGVSGSTSVSPNGVDISPDDPSGLTSESHGSLPFTLGEKVCSGEYRYPNQPKTSVDTSAYAAPKRRHPNDSIRLAPPSESTTGNIHASAALPPYRGISANSQQQSSRVYTSPASGMSQSSASRPGSSGYAAGAGAFGASQSGSPASQGKSASGKDKEPDFQVFVVKRLGKVIAVFPIHRVETYKPGKKEKMPKHALAWVETEDRHPVLKFYYKKHVYSTDFQ